MIQEDIKQHIIVVTGIKGSGKTLLAKALSGIVPGTYLCGITDRPIKEYEVDGVDFLFLTKEDMGKVFPKSGPIMARCPDIKVSTISGIPLSDRVDIPNMSDEVIHTEKLGKKVIPVQKGFIMGPSVNIISVEADVFSKVTRNLSKVGQTWVIIPTDVMRAQRYAESTVLSTAGDRYGTFIKSIATYLHEEEVVKSLALEYRGRKHVEVADLGHLSFEGIKSLACSVIKRVLGKHDG